MALARSLHPDAITLDVLMPGLDAWAVLTALKGDVATAAIPVVMLTMLDDRNLGFAPARRSTSPSPWTASGCSPCCGPGPRERPVLVVDDDPVLRDLLRRMLEREGDGVRRGRQRARGPSPRCARAPWARFCST